MGFLFSQEEIASDLVEDSLNNYLQNNYTTPYTQGYNASRDILYGEIDNNNGYITSPSSGGSTATRGFIIGGHSPSPSPGKVDYICYLTTATLGNAVDFGNLDQARSSAAAVSSPTRIVNGGGAVPSPSQNYMDYWEIATTGNAVDFGDLSYNRFSHGSTSNAHGGL